MATGKRGPVPRFTSQRVPSESQSRWLTFSIFFLLLLHPASGGARISKSGGSEYVNIGTPEETLLETYFVTLSKFNFDRAREQCVSLNFFKLCTCTPVHLFTSSKQDRERENKGSGSGANWCEFISVLSRLATAESVYFSLGFMERSGALGRFVRKEVR